MYESQQEKCDLPDYFRCFVFIVAISRNRVRRGRSI